MGPESVFLNDKVVVITGGAGEIGRVLTQRLVNSGAIVVITGRTLSKLQEFAASILTQPGKPQRIHCLEIDSTDWNSLQSGFARIKDLCGQIDVLINNAGTPGALQRLDRLPFAPSETQRTETQGSANVEIVGKSIQGLLGGPWLTTLAAMDLFAAEASIINVSTILSKTEYYGRIPYTVAKAGLNCLSTIMAKELGSKKGGIRVNAIYPGPVAGERIHQVFAKMDELQELSPHSTKTNILSRMTLKPNGTMGELLTKDEIVNTILFLSSSASSGLTGQHIEIAHGLELPQDSSVNVVENPQLSRVDFCKRTIWLLAGEDENDTLAAIQRFGELGANILLSSRNPSRIKTLRESLKNQSGPAITELDISSTASWMHSLSEVQKHIHNLVSVVVFPGTGLPSIEEELTQIHPKQVHQFLSEQIEEVVFIAHQLDIFFRRNEAFLSVSPQITFVSHSPRHAANALTKIYSSAVQSLIRTWRSESKFANGHANQKFPLKINQLCRHEYTAVDNHKVVADWLAYLAGGTNDFSSIDLQIDPSLIYSSAGKCLSADRDVQVLSALHSQRVALITGGSEGIGSEISRHLVLAGAKITIAERSSEKLGRVRSELIRIAKSCGYSDPSQRIHLMPNCDVTQEDTIQGIVGETVRHFGRIDYLINNAGLTGAEKMVVDMPISSWIQTLEGNLISNYLLLLKALPSMKMQKSGVILNMSSYFGASRHGLVPYTNRADYAVSKAGQIAMAEALAPIIGPDVFINAFAPGPVDGARLNGRIGYPGLYSRRSRLILENKSVNLIYSTVISAIRNGANSEAVEKALASNSLPEFRKAVLKNGSNEAFEHYMKFLDQRQSKGYLDKSTEFMNSAIVETVMRRLQLCGVLPPRSLEHTFLDFFKEPDKSLFSQDEINAGAQTLRTSVVKHCAMGKMPSDRDLAFQVVWSLAGQVETGEVLYPSGGFRYDGLQLGRTFRADGVNLDARVLKSSLTTAAVNLKVLILGNSLLDRMAEISDQVYRSHENSRNRSGSIIIAVTSDKSRAILEREFDTRGMRGKVEILVEQSRSLDLVLSRMIASDQKPDIVISFPLLDLDEGANSQRISDSETDAEWRKLPSITEFRELVHGHLTNHFSIAKISTLIESCKTIFVTSASDCQTSPAASALAQIFSKALRPLVIAANKEASFFNPSARLFQVEANLPANEFCQIIEHICFENENIVVTAKAA